MAVLQTVHYDLQNKVEIGCGAFGKVYKVKDITHNKWVALKAVSNFSSTDKEVKLLQQCDSPFIVKFFEKKDESFSTLIIMEYCSRGSLEDILRKKNKCFKEPEIQQIMRHILKGLNYLHSKKIMHRDIKPANILLGDDNNYKLSDFGLAKTAQFSMASTYCGSPLYMAPEIINSQIDIYNKKCDVYGVGITAIHLYIYSGKLNKDIININKVKQNPSNLSNIVRSNSVIFIDFIAKCIINEPSQRISINQLINHDFITSNNNNNQTVSADNNNQTQDAQQDEMKTCSYCKGSKVIQQQTQQQIRNNCQTCNGTGHKPKHCRFCKGTGQIAADYCGKCRQRCSLYTTGPPGYNKLPYCSTHGKNPGGWSHSTDKQTCYQCNGAGKGGPAHGLPSYWRCGSCNGQGHQLSYTTRIASVACTYCQ
eukprot:425929_1